MDDNLPELQSDLELLTIRDVLRRTNICRPKKRKKIRDQGSISSKCLRTAFTLADPKNLKAAWVDCLFALLGSASLKAVRKHVGKINPRTTVVEEKRTRE